jgi:hypothetical protein
MSVRRVTLFARGLVLAILALQDIPGLAKTKQEKTLPEYVLAAKSVAVMIDPTAGMDADDPRANDIARKDVETALAKWGRFEPVVHPEYADIVIVIRKGHPQTQDATMPDPPRQPGTMNPNDNGIRMGAQHSVDGTQPVNPQRPQQQEIEMAPQEDSFVVYQGWKANPASGPVAWRKDQRDGLHSHDVPVVDEFRKAVDAAQKAAEAKNR